MTTDNEAKKKNRAAAIAGVLHYIQTEEEIARRPETPAARALSCPPVNAWGISGRQAQMQLRNLMQIKAFHRTGNL